jgi:CBS domain-containing protein
MIPHKLRALDVMSADVKSVEATQSLVEAITLMDRYGFGQLPVLSNGRPTGLLTEGDVRRALLAGKHSGPVSEVASALPDLIQPVTRISYVLHSLQHQDSVLVVGPDNELVGIITYWDILILTRPALMVKEVELLLRQVVAAAFLQDHGPNWWGKVPDELRRRAEEEHSSDEGEEPTPEHMLGHTSFWVLIELFRHIRPQHGDERFALLHKIREFRNRVVHYYRMPSEELEQLATRCHQAGDWLEELQGLL